MTNEEIAQKTIELQEKYIKCLEREVEEMKKNCSVVMRANLAEKDKVLSLMKCGEKLVERLVDCKQSITYFYNKPEKAKDPIIWSECNYIIDNDIKAWRMEVNTHTIHENRNATS